MIESLNENGKHQEGIQRPRITVVYNIDPDRFNCQPLFSNYSICMKISSIKFMRNIKGYAMAEFEKKQAI